MRKQLIDKNVGGMVDSGLIAVWIRFDKGWLPSESEI